MPDTFAPAFRSEVMSHIRSSGTTPERRLRQLLIEPLAGIEVRCNVETLPGRPDVVIDDLRIAVFADGCFFHRCPLHWRLPSTNAEYWQAKVVGNRRRDRRNSRALRATGWAVWRVWEHDLKPTRIPATARRLARLAERRRQWLASAR